MVKKWKPIQEINITPVLSVVSCGGGLSLSLPKDTCEVYSIIGGDKMRVKLITHFKRDWEAEKGGEEPQKPRKGGW